MHSVQKLGNPECYTPSSELCISCISVGLYYNRIHIDDYQFFYSNMMLMLPEECWLKLFHWVRFEAFTAVSMKNVVFFDVVLCRSCVDQCFGGTYRLHLQGSKIRERSTSVGRWVQTQDLHSATFQKTTFFLFHWSCCFCFCKWEQDFFCVNSKILKSKSERNRTAVRLQNGSK
jgi:hypothetical protein